MGLSFSSQSMYSPSYWIVQLTHLYLLKAQVNGEVVVVLGYC